MIGDWVFYPSLSIYIKIAQIKGNTIISELAECSPGMMYDVTPHVSDIEPISLTKEILKKNDMHLFDSNRFKEHYIYSKNGIRSRNHISVIFYDDESILVEIENKSVSTDGVNRVHNCDINYVHELQHALKLCKIDINIKL